MKLLNLRTPSRLLQIFLPLLLLVTTVACTDASTQPFIFSTAYQIASGEASGNLEDMLERAAIIQERERETWIGILLNLFEPLLILLMGGMVLTIVLAILMPIFELNQLVK